MNNAVTNYMSKATLLRLGAFLLTSLLFIAVFATIASPFNDNGGLDYGIFRTMGDFWRRGGAIYRDLFDSKGPYLFLIQVTGLTISDGKWGLYVLEALNMTVCLELMYLIGKTLKATTLRNIIAILCFLIYFALTIEWGNTVEEWSLPYVLLPLWLCIHYVKSGHTAHPHLYSFIYGLCFGIISMMRINNGAIIVGIILGLTYIYLRKRQYKDLGINALYVISGVAAGVLPAIIYFWAQGALDDMLYATFFYNIKYRDAWFADNPNRYAINASRMVVCGLVVIASYVYDRKNHSRTLPAVLCMAAVTFMTFLGGADYPHYFTMVSPLVYLLAVLCVSMRWWAQLLCLILTVYPLFNNWGMQVRMLRILHLYDDVSISPSPQQLIQERYSFIPEADLDSIYILQLHWPYLDMLYQEGHVPVGKYFISQANVSNVDEYAHHDIIEHFDKANPRWVISSVKIEDSVMADYGDNYTLADSCGTSVKTIDVYLYRRKDLDSPR